MQLRYVELSTDRIFNWLDPFNVTAKWACKAITGDWWSEENVAIRRFFADEWTKEFDRLTGHFTNLEASMRKEGIRTPICCDSGAPRGTYLKPLHYPEKFQHDLTQAIHTRMFGGSRLTLAEKIGIETVACVVNDYGNLFPDAPEITRDNYKTWFGNEYSFVASNPPSLRSLSMTTNTKQDQDAAATVARASTYAKFGLMDPIS